MCDDISVGTSSERLFFVPSANHRRQKPLNAFF